MQHLQSQDNQTEMALCMWCTNAPTHFAYPFNLNYPQFFNCGMGYRSPDSAEAHRSFYKESRNLYCEYCGMGFFTPAESTDHAQSHRRHFCFVCGIEAHLVGRELPGQHCRVVGHDQYSVKANAKTPQTASPQIKVKKVLGHRPRSSISPYSTQRRNIQVEKDLCIGDLLKWLGGLTVGQRACVNIKAAGLGQVMDYLSDRDLLQLALVVRS